MSDVNRTAKSAEELLETKSSVPSFAKLYVTTLVIVVFTELIGIIRFKVGAAQVVLLPMLYAVVIGILLTPHVLGKPIAALKKLVSFKEVEIAGPLVMVALLPLGVKYGTLVGPNIVKIAQAGPAFLLQELGNLGTIFAAFPLAMLLGLKREAVGATVSICREPTLGIIGERYGIASPEGTGVLGTYLTGTIFGTIFFSLLGSFSVLTGLHPYALAMACGVGSASMMTASSSALSQTVPAMKDTILAYAATSNMLTGITGMYSVIFLGLPLVNFFYKKFGPKDAPAAAEKKEE
jgi:hypothetical protein